MSETVTASSGSEQQSASGDVDAIESADSSSGKDTVAYETYKKVVAEKKRRDAELAAKDEELKKLKAAEKERVESELKAKEDYKKLLEIREKEIQEKDRQLKEVMSDIEQSTKFEALLSALPGQVPKKFWTMIDTTQIVIDPNTGSPDPSSVKKAAETFQANFPELIVQPGKAKLPNTAAAGTGQAMTEEVWKGLDPKQKKERLPEYVESLKQNRGR